MPCRNRPLAQIRSLLLIAAAVIAPASGVLAFDAQSDTPIEVEADNARLDDRAGTATYTGNVVIIQGETRLKADEIVLQRRDGELDTITATGQPAHYEQPARADEPPLQAEAERIIFARQENTLTFERNALIEQEGDTFRGDVIRYDTVERVVTASGGEADETRDGRVRMVIQPRRAERESRSED